MANLGQLRMESWGSQPSSDSEKKFNLPLCLRPQNDVAKGNLRFAQFVRKSALQEQNLLFFICLLGSLPSPSPLPLSLLPGFIDLLMFSSKNACHISFH